MLEYGKQVKVRIVRERDRLTDRERVRERERERD